MMQDYIVFVGVNMVLAWSVYVILLAGSLSFANGGFMSIGAYASGVLTVKFGMPLIPAALIAGLIAGAVGVLVGFPALRTRGIYLMLVTVGITVSLKAVIESIDYVGGIQGFGGMVGTRPWHVIALVILVGCGLWFLSKSPLQRILDAVREDELSAASLGINTVYVKLVCFGIGAFLAALAGSLYAHHLIHVTPDQFGIVVSVFIVLYAVLGGTNNMWGPPIGAVIMTLIPEVVRGLESWRPTAFGVIILVLLLIRPDGLLAFREVTTRANKSWVTGKADESKPAKAKSA